MERMNASLSYYKGFNLRTDYQYIDNWLTIFEGTSTYRGTQGIFILTLMIYRHKWAVVLKKSMKNRFISLT